MKTNEELNDLVADFGFPNVDAFADIIKREVMRQMVASFENEGDLLAMVNSHPKDGPHIYVSFHDELSKSIDLRAVLLEWARGFLAEGGGQPRDNSGALECAAWLRSVAAEIEQL